MDAVASQATRSSTSTSRRAHLISVHADDILIAAPHDRVPEIRELMGTGLKMKWGEEITEHPWTRYLGKEWRRTTKGFEMRLPQRYVNALLELARLERAKGVNTPAIPGRGGGSGRRRSSLMKRAIIAAGRWWASSCGCCAPGRTWRLSWSWPEPFKRQRVRMNSRCSES